jgi:hypothetical protein
VVHYELSGLVNDGRECFHVELLRATTSSVLTHASSPAATSLHATYHVVVLELSQALDNVADGVVCEIFVVNKRAGHELGDPVLVPDTVEEVSVKGSLEEVHVHLVIFMSMLAKLFSFL